MDQTPKLLWHPVIQKGHKAGEALVAAELILKDKVWPKSNQEQAPFDKKNKNIVLARCILIYIFLSVCSWVSQIFPWFPQKEQRTSTWFLRASGLWFSSPLWR